MAWRRILSAVLLAALTLALAIGSADAAAKKKKSTRAPAPEKYAALVFDPATNEVLFERHGYAPRYPASLTKMMTLYMLFEALESGKVQLDARLPVSARAAAQPPSKLGLTPGGRIRVEDAIRALVTKSANDVAATVAEYLGGTETMFAEKMTLRARRLGMNLTTYRNASGLPDAGQVTSAFDQALLAQALMRDFPRYYGYFSERGFAYAGAYYGNHNRLMSEYPGMDGLKTGFIGASGFNLAATAVRDGRRLIAVVFGGTTARARDAHLADLLDRGFSENAPVLFAQLNGAVVPVAANQRLTAAAIESKPKPVRKPTELAAAAPLPPIEERTAANRSSFAFVAPANAATPSPAAPLPAALRGATAKPGAWSIQVGSFRSVEGSQRAIDDASARLGALAAQAKGEILPLKTRRGTLYRARLSGFDQSSATRACRALADCLAVAPNG
jgi:D-alanyl-D-alanine carboxypeptidase